MSKRKIQHSLIAKHKEIRPARSLTKKKHDVLYTPANFFNFFCNILKQIITLHKEAKRKLTDKHTEYKSNLKKKKRAFVEKKEFQRSVGNN